MIRKFILPFFLVFVTACSSLVPGAELNIDLVIRDFVPFEENSFFRFGMNEGNFGYTEDFVIHTSENRFQIVSELEVHYFMERGYTDELITAIATSVYEIADGEFRRIFSVSSDDAIEEDITDIDNTDDIILVFLQEPLILGHSWHFGVDGGISEITRVNEVVETPLGIFEDVMQVTTSFPYPHNEIYYISYYAPGYGRIKTVEIDGRISDSPITNFLISITS